MDATYQTVELAIQVAGDAEALLLEMTALAATTEAAAIDVCAKGNLAACLIAQGVAALAAYEAYQAGQQSAAAQRVLSEANQNYGEAIVQFDEAFQAYEDCLHTA
jgi:hypothetical protein